MKRLVIQEAFRRLDAEKERINTAVKAQSWWNIRGKNRLREQLSEVERSRCVLQLEQELQTVSNSTDPVVIVLGEPYRSWDTNQEYYIGLWTGGLRRQA